MSIFQTYIEFLSLINFPSAHTCMLLHFHFFFQLIKHGQYKDNRDRDPHFNSSHHDGDRRGGTSNRGYDRQRRNSYDEEHSATGSRYENPIEIGIIIGVDVMMIIMEIEEGALMMVAVGVVIDTLSSIPANLFEYKQWYLV